MGKPKPTKKFTAGDNPKRIRAAFEKAGCSVEDGNNHYHIDCPDVEGKQYLSKGKTKNKNGKQISNLNKYLKQQLDAN